MKKSADSTPDLKPKAGTSTENSRAIAKAYAPILIRRLKAKGIHPNNSPQTKPKELTPEESQKVAKALYPILLSRLRRKGILPPTMEQLKMLPKRRQYTPQEIKETILPFLRESLKEKGYKFPKDEAKVRETLERINAKR